MEVSGKDTFGRLKSVCVLAFAAIFRPAHLDNKEINPHGSGTQRSRQGRTCTPDARISELESRPVQDETIQKLSDEMVQLQGKLFAQDKQLKRLMDRLKAAAGDEDGADPNQVEPPPPH